MLFKVKQVERKSDYYLMAFILIIAVITVGALSRVPNRLILYSFCLLMGGLIVWIYYSIQAVRSVTYTIDQQGITVHYGFKNISIPWNTIFSVEYKAKVNLVRFAGSEWPGNYTGYFRQTGSPDLIAAYSTSKKEVVLISTTNLKYLISPDDPGLFLDEASKYQVEDISISRQEPQKSLWEDLMGRRMIILNILAVIFVMAVIQYTAGSYEQVPLHYNLRGEVDRYGSPYEMYLILIGPGVLMPIIIYISSNLHRAGVKDAAAYLWIPLLFTALMGMVVVSMVYG